MLAGPSSDSKDIVWHTVTKGPLDQTVIERGALEATESKEIVCPVKANKGGTFATTIKNLYVEDGETVKKGQLLIELDSASLRDQLDSQNITKDKAKLDWEKAENDLIIQLSQNDTEMEKAKTDLTVAELDLKKYLEGDYPASLEDVNNRLEQWKDRVAYSDRMVKKGYMTSTQALADRYALQKVQKDAIVLELDKKKTVATKQSALDEAKRNLERVKEKTKAAEATSRKTAANNKSVYNQELARAKDLENEIAKCTIKAPQDGIIVYVVPEQARWAVGGQQSIVAQGESVREAQKLLRIIKLSSTRWQVTIKVHEAFVDYLRPGQPALIRLDGFRDKVLHGHVKSVANVDSKQDFMAADVKVYQTVIIIDEKDSFRGLKPGNSADVTILVNRLRKPGLLIPVQAISDPQDGGKNPTCFVKNEDGEPEEREIEVGLANDTMAEVKPEVRDEDGRVVSGLKEGDQVVMNPGKLLKKKRSQAKGGKKGKEEKKGAAFGPAKVMPPNGNGKPAFSPPGKPGFAPGAKPGPGATKGVPGKGKPGAGSPRPNMNPEQMQQMIKQRVEMFKKATPEKQKEMLQKIPEQYREGFKGILRQNGVKVPD
jgi:HlyD family secretion protein